MTVLVYSGNCLIEDCTFNDLDFAYAYADYWQDEGYKVRMVES